MLEKYHSAIWNFFSAFLIIATFLIAVKKPKPVQLAPKDPKDGVISQIDTTTTIWKRGEFSSTTVVKENRSFSNIDKYFHKSPDWTTIKWKKNNDPKS